MKYLRSVFIILLIVTFFSCEKSSTSSNTVYITFADVNFEQLIRDTIEKPEGDITQTDMEMLTELIGNGLGIIDLTGIEYCINLVYLDLSDNQIVDISQLVDNNGFDADDFIDLQGNPLNNTAKDTYIPQLQARGVYVYYDESDVVVVITDVNFETLIRGILQKPSGDITNNDLASMTKIDGRNSGVNDITGIEYCKNLTYLDLYNCGMTDISAIKGLRKLKDLYLYRNNVSSIEYITGMSQLRNVSIGHNNISDISTLTTLPKLVYLSIGDNPIADLSIIGNLTNLTYISIVTLNLTNLNLIQNLTNLESIEARYNHISDIAALGNLTELGRIAIDGNSITDISVISTLTKLNDISFNSNNISDISVITSLPNLTGAGFGNNNLSDISPIADATCDFDYIYIADNQITDIKPIVDNANITDGDDIYIANNPLNETSINTYIPQLEARGVTVHQ